VAFGVFYAIKNSQLDDVDGVVRLVKYGAFVISLGFSMLSILRNFTWTLYHKVAFAVLFFIPLYLRIKYDSIVICSSMLIMAAYNIPFSHIVRSCIRALIVVFAIVLVSVGLGVIEDRTYYRDVDNFEKSYAHDLGFRYYSYYAYLGMGLVQCCIYKWRHHISLGQIAFLVAFSYVFFLLSSTRLQLYACAAFIVAILAVPYIPKKIINNKILASLAIIAYPVICVLLYFVSKYMILSMFYDGYDELNKLMSSRLSLNEEAFVRYDVTLWGNNLEFSTAERTTDYFYIDSGYLHVLLGDGLVFTAIILLLYSILTYKLFRSRAYYLYIWIIFYSILNISNGFLVALLANPILFLAFSDTKSISYDYNLDEEEAEEEALELCSNEEQSSQNICCDA
jgi:hypothetical protein